MHDKSLRSCTDKMEWVAGYERKRRCGCGVKNLGIVWGNDPHPIDLVSRHSA